MAEKLSMQRLIVVLLMAVSLSLGACASKKPKPAASTTPSEASANANAGGAADAASALAAGTNPDDEAQGPQGGLLATRVVYFDFDSSEIKPEFNDLVSAHAHYLASNASIRVRLEGNTDERGSREYNIGLGERRAQAVRRALMLQGVSESQIATVSYGEERPAVTGHTEEAWARNRRVELVYLN